MHGFPVNTLTQWMKDALPSGIICMEEVRGHAQSYHHIQACVILEKCAPVFVISNHGYSGFVRLAISCSEKETFSPSLSLCYSKNIPSKYMM